MQAGDRADLALQQGTPMMDCQASCCCSGSLMRLSDGVLDECAQGSAKRFTSHQLASDTVCLTCAAPVHRWLRTEGLPHRATLQVHVMFKCNLRHCTDLSCLAQCLLQEQQCQLQPDRPGCPRGLLRGTRLHPASPDQIEAASLLVCSSQQTEGGRR